VLGWSLGLAGIAAMQLAVSPSVASSGDSMQAMVDQWPEALQEAFGLDAYSTGPGFLNAELFSMLFPLAMTAVALTFAGGATAGEEEKGTADVLFSLPVRRVTVLAGKVTAMVLAVVAVTACGVLTVVLGAPLVDLSVGTWEVVAGGAMTALLGLLFGAFGVLVGAVTGSRAATVGLGMCLAITAFLLNALAPLADWLEPWKDASPFSWALGGEPLTQGMDWAMAAVLLGVAVLFVLAGGVLFRRRDISSR
jgi:ABC-2 type transport system permease protein